MRGDDRRTVDRRAVLGSLASAGAASLAGCSMLPLPGSEDAPTDSVDAETARRLAEQYAPTLYFDAHERWFPTDPRPYVTRRDGEPVVDGFDALDGYADAFDDPAAPPAPTVFYNAVRYRDSPLAVVQFWYYSAFDQFTTNFHWHDWEVFHAFVDTDAGEPQLYVASSHSRSVPNNEFLDPDPDAVPRVLSELGSHSSALSVNEAHDQFDRFSVEGLLADITNSALEGLDVASLPLAYGLPRDEGSRLPYVVPELDGAPVYEHERLPAVERSDLVPPALTVRSLADLSTPPTDLPGRETGLTFRHADRDGAGAAGSVAYDLVPAAELEHVTAFTGPQLSFEFAVPEFAEDAVASHITTTSAPWTQPRYENPAADVTDASHRGALAERYDAVGAPPSLDTVAAAVTEAVPADLAPDGAGLTTEEPSVEAVALLESDPVAVPTFRGVVAAQGVPGGDHRLTVNGAGLAPHSETVSVAGEGGTTAAGVAGEIPLVARRDATKLEVDPRTVDADLTDLAVEDDFAGRLYDAPLSGPDAVYVHRGGAYTTEVRDADGAVGAFRVTPAADQAAVRIEEPRTGAGSLAGFLAAVAEETRADVAAVAGDEGGDEDGTGSGSGRGTTTTGGPVDGTGTSSGSDTPTADGGGSGSAVRGLARALAAVTEAARRAEERASAGDRGGVDEALSAVATRLDRVATRLAAASDDLPAPLARAAGHRLVAARRRAEQARAAEKL